MQSDNKITFMGMLIWVICALFFMYEFLLRTVVGTFQHPIMYDLDLTAFKFAILSSTAYLAIYGAMQIPVGVITDKFGLKRSLLLGVTLCFLPAIAFAFTRTFHSAIFFRMLMGLGSSFGFVCLLIAVYDWLPHKHSGLFIGLSQFIGTMGPMMAAGPLESVASEGGLDWRNIFVGLGLLGLVILLLVFLFVRNNHKKAGKFVLLRRPEPIKMNLKRLLSQKQTWLIALFSASVYFAIEYLSENEGKSFIMLNGFSGKFASYMITLSWLGYAIGCPLLGFLSDRLNRRKSMMVVAAICCVAAMVTIVYFPVNRAVLIAAFFFLGIGASGQSVGFAIMAEQCSKNYLAAGLGFNNAMITLVASINAPVVGWLLDYFAQGGKPSLANYHSAFAFVIGLASFSLILSIFGVKETFCKSVRGMTYLTR